VARRRAGGRRFPPGTVRLADGAAQHRGAGRPRAQRPDPRPGRRPHPPPGPPGAVTPAAIMHAAAITHTGSMYVPAHFAMDDAAVRELLDRHGAADLVTATPDGLVATMLPFVHDRTAGEHGALLGHVARNNPQWRA